MLEKRKEPKYVIDRASYGDMAIMREYNYGKYFLIEFSRRGQLVPGDVIQIDDWRKCLDKKCAGYLNGNYQSPINIQIAYHSDNQYKVYDRFKRETGIR